MTQQNLDKFTFGNSRCATDVVDIINRDGIPSRRFTKYWSNFNRKYSYLFYIRNEEDRRYFLELLVNYYINKSKYIPERIRSYFINLVKTQHRIYLRVKNKWYDTDTK